MAKLSQKAIESKMQHLAELCDGTVYRGYSGRGMYGACCWGVSAPESDISPYLRRCKLGTPCRDNLGLDYIHYWPNLEYTPDEL